MRATLRLLGALVAGVLIAAVGTVMHRSSVPWGMVLCLALVLTAGVGVRAATGRGTSCLYLIGLLVTIGLLSRSGPGGDVLMPSSGALSWVWLIGAAVVGFLGLAAPDRWFADLPLRRPRAERG